MTVPDVMMLAIAVIGGAAALLVVTSRNVVHSALFLVVALLAVAGAFLALGAEFVAWAQVLVYVGAVVILILFGLMLTRAPIGPMAQHNELGKALPVAVAGGLFAVLVVLIFGSFGDTTIELVPVTPAAIGEVLYVDWALPFMALGFLLTVALIGAVVIARREEGEGPLPEPDPDRDDALRHPAETDASTQPGVVEPQQEQAQAPAPGAAEPVRGRGSA
jgi:NADH-quinone oxidoreductase subunit J